MNGSRWHTTQDVLQDLADVTGIRGTDEGFILRGQKPPSPLPETAEEDEIQLRFGNAGDHVATRSQYNTSTIPDLAGITKMLRMVDKCEPRNGNGDSRKTPGPVKIVISKLNPDVEEFVPKRAGRSPCVEQEKEPKNDIKSRKNNDISEIKEKAKVPSKASSPENSLKSEKLKLETILKNRIMETANASTMKEKRDRNVALMNLMKLNTIPSTGSPIQALPKSSSSLNSSGTNSPKPILIPPEFFEHSSAEKAEQESKSTSLNDSSNYNVTTSAVNSSTPNGISPVSVSTDITSSTSANVNNNDFTSTSNVSMETSDSTEPKENLTNKILDPTIKESIEKVNKWFDEPKKKVITPQLGPIIYRKKESAKQSETLTESKPKSATPAYVPSQYASDLAKKYEERSKVKAIASQDIWTKLENDLKAKDQEIIKRLKEPNESDQGSMSNSSSRSSSRRNNYL